MIIQPRQRIAVTNYHKTGRQFLAVILKLFGFINWKVGNVFHSLIHLGELVQTWHLKKSPPKKCFVTEFQLLNSP